jgi:phage terminase small subunit
MGLRGPLPKLKLIDAEKLRDLSAPLWLCEEAAAFWDRHATNLAANNLLTVATADSLAMTADLWARYRAEDKPSMKVQLSKQFIAAARYFRLLPCDKPGSTTATRHDDKEEFEF